MSKIHDSIRQRHKEVSGPVGVVSAFSSETSLKEAGDDRHLRIVVTTDDIDLVGEVVDPKGADLSYINSKGQNKVFADHYYNIDHCVGKLRYLTYWPNAKNPRGLMASIAMRKGHELSDECWKIAQQLGIGASIGFEATEYTDFKSGDPDRWKSASGIIRKWRLLEVSLTCMPCNVACQSEACESPDDSKSAMLETMVTKGLIRRSTAEAFGLERKNVPPVKLRIIRGA